MLFFLCYWNINTWLKTQLSKATYLSGKSVGDFNNFINKQANFLWKPSSLPPYIIWWNIIVFKSLVITVEYKLYDIIWGTKMTLIYIFMWFSLIRCKKYFINFYYLQKWCYRHDTLRNYNSWYCINSATQKYGHSQFRMKTILFENTFLFFLMH